MSPTFAILRKEFHQHGALAATMIGLVLFMCVLICFLSAGDSHLDPYYSIAVIFALIYLGASAAVVYSAEHEENTFGFLRNLPVSPKTIALGKTAWVLCSFFAVLCSNLLIAFLWATALNIFSYTEYLFYDQYPNNVNIWEEIAFLFVFVEVFFWGLFWSTRCRRQMVAVLATYISPIAVYCFALWVCYLIDVNMTNIDFPHYLFLYRLLVAAVVAFFALYGMLNWFEFDKKRSTLLRLVTEERVWLRYPKRVQSPFFALFHLQLRQASIIYHFGLCCFAASSIALLYCCYERMVYHSAVFYDDWAWLVVLICSPGILLFWGTIFGADQKNHSYRFLMRIGVHEGTIWWSRMLIPFLCYIPVLVCVLLFCYCNELPHNTDSEDLRQELAAVSEDISMYFFLWLSVAALGAYWSISCHRQILSAMMTFGMMFCLFLWAMLLSGMFGLSPWWTIVPICIALLIASRLRAKYWLRDITTFRSRLVPLVPVIGVVLVVLLTIPPIRMYSLPDVSWEQIALFLDQTEMHERLSPEKRAALLEYVAENGLLPLEVRERNRRNKMMPIRDESYSFLSPTTPTPPKEGNYSPPSEGCPKGGVVLSTNTQILHQRLQYQKEHVANMLTWEEQLLVLMSDAYVSLHNLDNQPDYVWAIDDLVLLPWEIVRLKKLHRLEMVLALVHLGALKNEKALSLREQYDIRYFNAAHDYWVIYGAKNRLVLWHQGQITKRLRLVFDALNCWQADRGTLPESLDELVGVYLDALPVDPVSGAAVEYVCEGTVPSGVKDLTPLHLGVKTEHKTESQSESWMPDALSGTYLRLGEQCISVLEAK